MSNLALNSEFDSLITDHEDYRDLVDSLADIKAEISDLEQKEKRIKDKLIASGYSAIDGTYHRASVSYIASKPKTDWQAVALAYNPPASLIAKYTEATKPYYMVRLSGRKTRGNE